MCVISGAVTYALARRDASRAAAEISRRGARRNMGAMFRTTVLGVDGGTVETGRMLI